MTHADDKSWLRNELWRVQPKWVKAISLTISLPAWLIFVSTIFVGSLGGAMQSIAFGTFFVIAVLQTAFIVRAFWRMDL